MAHREELTHILGERLKQRTTQEWLEDFDAAGVPAGPINDIAAMVSDPQTLAREMVVELDHPKTGRTRALGLPLKFSQTPGKVVHPAPLLGQHTREVLNAAGYSAKEIVRLAEAGAIGLG